MTKLLLPTSVAVAVAVILGGCASTPAEDDPVQVKLNDLDARVARIERVVSNQSLVQLAQNLDSVQEETRRLRGRIEELEHTNDSLKKQLATSAAAGRGSTSSGAGVPPYPSAYGPGANAGGAYSGSPGGAGPGAGVQSSSGAAGAGVAGSGGVVGESAGAANGAGAAGPGGAATAGAGGAAGVANGAGGDSGGTGATVGSATGAAAANAVAPGPGATDAPSGGGGASSVEQAVYSQAFSALKAGSYSVAITGFKDFLVSYPSSTLAENAQYWLGEAYYVTRSYDDAATAFHTVLQKYPQSRKAPDAMLKLGYTQYEQKRYGDARKTLQEVTQKYPDSAAARLAAERLKRIPASAPKS
jgi:tol-pal system protein YbgF